MRNFVLNLWLSQKFFVPLQAKSKTYGMRRTTEYITQLGGINIADQIVAVGTEECSVSDDACVLYPNPYMVVTKTGYTKHYYAGTERLATVIGGGGLGEIGNPVDGLHSQHDLDIISSFHSRYSDYDPFEHENNLSEPVGTVGIDGTPNPRLDYTCSSIVLTDLDVLTHQNILLEAIEQNAPTMTLEQNVYFYHGDHLGSANWITDGGGNPTQYIHYAPYGELIANQQTIGYDERYKFTGKERDWETGYDYFGARYYDFRKGFWNSVDPLADNYPGNTPYLYCNGNPIMLIDPDGRVVIAASRVAQERLLSTLSCEERGYVSFDTKGQINLDRLNRCNSTSHNMTALKALANSTDVTYNFYVRSSSTSGETSGEKMIEAGGVTEMYGLDKDASLDPSIVNIISGAHLEGEAAARNMAHEAFTHAYLYEINGHDGRAAGHNRPNKEANQRIYRDPVTGVEYLEYEGVFENHPNDLLNQYNEKAQSEASKNYNCGL